MNEIIRMNRKTNITSKHMFTLGLMTAMPGSATKITSKQTTLGCRAKQNVILSMRNYDMHHPAPLSLYNQNMSLTFLTTKTMVRKNQKNRLIAGSLGCGATHLPHLHTIPLSCISSCQKAEIFPVIHEKNSENEFLTTFFLITTVRRGHCA